MHKFRCWYFTLKRFCLILIRPYPIKSATPRFYDEETAIFIVSRRGYSRNLIIKYQAKTAVDMRNPENDLNSKYGEKFNELWIEFSKHIDKMGIKDG